MFFDPYLTCSIPDWSLLIPAWLSVDAYPLCLLSAFLGWLFGTLVNEGLAQTTKQHTPSLDLFTTAKCRCQCVYGTIVKTPKRARHKMVTTTTWFWHMESLESVGWHSWTYYEIRDGSPGAGEKKTDDRECSPDFQVWGFRLPAVCFASSGSGLGLKSYVVNWIWAAKSRPGFWVYSNFNITKIWNPTIALVSI